jgi:hypothetical protein
VCLDDLADGMAGGGAGVQSAQLFRKPVSVASRRAPVATSALPIIRHLLLASNRLTLMTCF